MTSELAESLSRARVHLAQAFEEALLGVRALLEAALIAGGFESERRVALGLEVDAALDELSRTLADARKLDAASAWGPLLLDAVEAEIERWRERAKSDRDAEPVLRAFVGLRSLLLGFGIRERATDPERPAPATPSTPPTAPRPPTSTPAGGEAQDVFRPPAAFKARDSRRSS